MKKWIQIIDDLIEKIPPHIRDIIHKASVALFALVVLVAVTIAVLRGLSDAKPGGMQIAEDTQDLFYLERLRDQNREKAKLLEDVPIDPSEFPSQQKQDDPFVSFGLDRSQKLMGEREDFLNDGETLRKKGDSLGEPLLQEPENIMLYADPALSASDEKKVEIKKQETWQHSSHDFASKEDTKKAVEASDLPLPSSAQKEELPFLE